MFLSSESDVKYAPSRGYIIFFPSLSLPYEKSLYVRTSFFISVCFRELKSFLTLNRGKKIIKKDNFWGDRNFFEAVLLKYSRVL